jgi:archaeosine-15-forming tRNA-guanine transglycosylase
MKEVAMNCEEFEIFGLGLDRDSDPDNFAAGARQAALQHADSCPRCAALQESWRDARAALEALREETEGASTPLRVEMRLRQEFYTRHRTLRVRAAAVLVAWALAGAVAVVGAVSWWNWRVTRTDKVNNTVSGSGLRRGSSNEATASITASPAAAADDSLNVVANDTALVAENDAEDFTLLPGSLQQETGDASVVRVRLQRGALAALGLPVNETRAGEWIQVDLFVGQDGQPQAVRLPR